MIGSQPAPCRKPRAPSSKLSLGARAVGIGRYYLFPLAAAGQAGVEKALHLMRNELTRDLKLMGCRSVAELSRENLRFR